MLAPSLHRESTDSLIVIDGGVLSIIDGAVFSAIDGRISSVIDGGVSSAIDGKLSSVIDGGVLSVIDEVSAIDGRVSSAIVGRISLRKGVLVISDTKLSVFLANRFLFRGIKFFYTEVVFNTLNLSFIM